MVHNNIREARRKPIVRALLMLLALSLALPVLPIASEGAGTAQAQNGCQTFRETGKTLCGKFLTYWQQHGGLAQQGFPISNEFNERSDIDGKTYTVQYFERAVFEKHPENAAPYDVLLSLLGRMRYQSDYPTGRFDPVYSTGELGEGLDDGSILVFPGTELMITRLFYDYWQQHGGLAQQGYPLSMPMWEVSALNGKEYEVQYFERAVFEYHPEVSGTSVLLAQLGTFQGKEKYPRGFPTGAVNPTSVPPTPVTRSTSVPPTPVPSSGKAVPGVYLFTNQGKKFKFRVSSAGRYVTDIGRFPSYYYVFSQACGGASKMMIFVPGEAENRIAIDTQGSFDDEGVDTLTEGGTTKFAWSFAGHFTGTLAEGTLSQVESVPGGGVICSTGVIRWTAERISP